MKYSLGDAHTDTHVDCNFALAVSATGRYSIFYLNTWQYVIISSTWKYTTRNTGGRDIMGSDTSQHLMVV